MLIIYLAFVSCRIQNQHQIDKVDAYKPFATVTLIIFTLDVEEERFVPVRSLELTVGVELQKARIFRSKKKTNRTQGNIVSFNSKDE